ncbi:MAG TPA: adhesin [Hyphomicrobium sp.]|nr:adhesin [Hyphomicrobium sp.]
MSAFSFHCPAAKSVRALFASCCAGAAALSAGGCANTNASYNSASAAPVAYVAQGPSVQMESDGLPVQAAPAATIRQLPDDPSQPFSPNYGGSNPASTIPSLPTVKAANDVPPVKPDIPYDLPPTFRRQLVAAVDAAG